MKKKSLVGWTYQDWFLEWDSIPLGMGYARASMIFKRKKDVRDKYNCVCESNPIKIRVTFEEIK